MKRSTRLLFLFFLTLTLFFVFSEQQRQQFNLEYLSQDPSSTAQEKVEEKTIINRIGERMTFVVMLGEVRLGKAYYEHHQPEYLDGQKVNVMTFVTKLPTFYDREKIYSDLQTFLPLLVERKVSRLVKPEKIREVYNQKSYRLSITKRRFTKEEMVIKKNGPIHNAILLPYFIRSIAELGVGWGMDVNLPQRKFKVKLVSLTDIEVPAGKFPAYYFESEPSQIKIWISNDEQRVPLWIEGTGSYGYKLELEEYFYPDSGY